jgi:hypothetical protein
MAEALAQEIRDAAAVVRVTTIKKRGRHSQNWRKRTAHLLTSAGNDYGNGDSREKIRREKSNSPNPQIPTRADC